MSEMVHIFMCALVFPVAFIYTDRKVNYHDHFSDICEKWYWKVPFLEMSHSNQFPVCLEEEVVLQL